MFTILFSFSLSLLFPLAQAEVLHLWPSESTAVSSPFGPRLKASDDYRYDFHRGLDISGELGDPIYAISSGEVYRVYEEGNTVYPDGGNVVILRHSDSTGDNFYSLYLHLNSIAVIEGDVVSQGFILGTMGQSGDTTFTHLHFEIREGTTCSLESQLEGGSCSYYGYDPHVNPMGYLGTDDQEAPELDILELNPLKVRISTSIQALDFNRIEVRIGIYQRPTSKSPIPGTWISL